MGGTLPLRKLIVGCCIMLKIQSYDHKKIYIVTHTVFGKILKFESKNLIRDRPIFIPYTI